MAPSEASLCLLSLALSLSCLCSSSPSSNIWSTSAGMFHLLSERQRASDEGGGVSISDTERRRRLETAQRMDILPVLVASEPRHWWRVHIPSTRSLPIVGLCTRSLWRGLISARPTSCLSCPCKPGTPVCHSLLAFEHTVPFACTCPSPHTSVPQSSSGMCSLLQDSPSLAHGGSLHAIRITCAPHSYTH